MQQPSGLAAAVAVCLLSFILTCKGDLQQDGTPASNCSRRRPRVLRYRAQLNFCCVCVPVASQKP